MHHRKRFDFINVVPFIDIMLVLFVIVLTTASFVQTGAIELDLPKAGAKAPKEKPPKMLKIFIKKDGEILFEKERVGGDEVERYLLKYDKRTPISLYCDRGVEFGKFVFLLDILKKYGYENLGIVTKK